MVNPWFRMYSEFADDPKIQMMPEAMQRRYVMLMCLRCSNVTVTLHETEIAFKLRISGDELTETKALFISKKFIDEKWNLLNWDKRQFLSDSSTKRVKKYRQKKKSKTGNVTETLPKRYSNALDTDTDTENKEPPYIPPTAPIAMRGSRIAVDWEPSPENLAWAKTKCPGVDLEAATEEFKNHWLDVPGWRGCKLAWGRTWQNRISELFKRLNKSGGMNAGRASQRECLTDRAARLGKLADEREAAAAAKAASDAKVVGTDDRHLRS